MSVITRVMFLLTLLFCAGAFARVHSQESKEGTGSISGRITVEGKPLSGVTVTLMSSESRYRPQRSPVAQANTDEDGRYRLTSVPAGQYLISALTPTLVAPTHSLSELGGKPVNVADGEEVEGIDFALIPGGVITGRVTDLQGRPLINEGVTLYQLDKQNRKRAVFLPNYHMFQTDDRGIYRLYGVPPGRYLVSAGVDLSRSNGRAGFGGRFYSLTFHPDATDESLAGAIEVTLGGEATDIDITVGRSSKTYAAMGRVIYTDTGKPAINVICGYGPLSPDGKNIQGGAFGHRADSEGYVRLEGLLPGRYAAFCRVEGESDYYSEPAVFEIKDENVSGLEIKVHRGAGISGVAVVEGIDDPDVLDRLQRLRISVFVQTTDLRAPLSSAMNLQPDGSFYIGGLSPGKARIMFSSFPPEHKGFHLVRVEREGIDQSGGIEIKAGEAVSGVRVVMAYGNSRIRGQVKIEGGSLPETVRLRVVFHRIEGTIPRPTITIPIDADERGRFLIEGLRAGEYEIAVIPFSAVPDSKIRPVKKNVTVNGYEDAEVTIIVDLSAKEKDRQ